jgi:GTP-binding protein
VAYALFNLQGRGVLFAAPGDPLYEGMVVGEHCRTGDLDVNPARGKKLTNMRASGSDEAVLLEPPRAITLELALEYIEDDELIEVTPKAVRLRKRALTVHEREKLRRAGKKAAAES